MPNVALYNIAGQSIGELELKESIFGIEPNASALHAVVKAYLANQRQGTQSALTRAEVRGGGIKIYRQKGTGPPQQQPRTDLHPRRRGVCAQAARLPRERQQEGKAPCNEERAFLQGERRRHHRL